MKEPDYNKTIVPIEYFETNPEFAKKVAFAYDDAKEKNASWYGPKIPFYITSPKLIDNGNYLMKRHIVTGSFFEPINDIIARAGIETRGDTWIYKGLSVTRPNDGNWRKKIRLEFGIYIRLRNEK